MKQLIALASIVCVFAASVGAAQETVGWRTDGTGHYPDANPPTVWHRANDKEKAEGKGEDKNIVWASKMPSWSNSSPAVAGDRVFVGSDKTDLVCVNRTTGEILWTATNAYIDGLEGQELEDAKAMIAAAEELRAKIKPEQDKLNNVRNRLKNIKSCKKKLADVEKETGDLKTEESRAARLAEIMKDIEAVVKALEKKPNDGNQKKRLEQITDQIKNLANKEWRTKRLEELVKQLAESQKKLAEAKPEEEEQLKNEEEQLKQVVDPLNKELSGKTKYDLPGVNGLAGYSTCTPVTDGKNVWTLLANGMAACYDLDGNRKWIRLIQKPGGGNGHTASPFSAGGNLIVQIQNTTRALNKDTGEEVWATNKASANHGTSVVTTIGDVDVIITSRGNVIRADNGTVLKNSIGGLGCNAPIVHDGVAYFIQENGKATKLPEEIKEEGMEFKELWKLDKIEGGGCYASPAYHDGLIYSVSASGHLSVIDAKEGSIVYDKKLDAGGTVFSSVVCAGKYVFAFGDKGKSVVFEAGREYKEVARNQLEALRSCPILADNRLYVRGLNHLYCVGE